MTRRNWRRVWVLGWLWMGCCGVFAAEAEFTVASYNLENYLELPIGSRPVKPEESRAKIQESLLNSAGGRAGGAGDWFGGRLAEVARRLKAPGIGLPALGTRDRIRYQHPRGGAQPISFHHRRPHTNEGFLLYGRRFMVSRGFAEVDVRVNARYQFTLITAHLKSRRESASADQADLREQEAVRLRRIIEARLQARPEANLVVLGDFNDHPDSAPLRILLARGKRHGLVDTRPAERNANGSLDDDSRSRSRQVTWTHFFEKEDVYSRIDYLLVSRGMSREWNPKGTYVLRMPNWGVGSDHRPIVARFQAVDR